MALADFLNDGDVNDTRTTLTQTLHIVSGSARDYAKAALGAANAVVEVAVEGGPCAQAYTNYAEIGKYMNLSYAALSNSLEIANILRQLNDSADDEANAHYASHLSDMVCAHEIGALLEGATSRLNLINAALPADPAPAARFNNSIFSARDKKQE